MQSINAKKSKSTSLDSQLSLARSFKNHFETAPLVLLHTTATTLGASPPSRTFHLKVRLIRSPFTFALAGTECWNRCCVCPSMNSTSPSPRE